VARSDRPSERPLLDKLGVKPGARVAVIGVDELWFRELLATRTDDVAVGRARQHSDLIFVRVDHRDDLTRVGPLQRSLVPNGAIWVIRPKGSPDIKDVDVIDAGIRAGLVDNKIASFSETLSAMRLVIPLARR
jgi:hypothetical protein